MDVDPELRSPHGEHVERVGDEQRLESRRRREGFTDGLRTLHQEALVLVPEGALLQADGRCDLGVLEAGEHGLSGRGMGWIATRRV